MNNTVYFNPEWMEALSFLKEESRNMLISAIITYQVTGEIPNLPAGKAVFMLMKLEVDHRTKRLADAREKRARKKNAGTSSPQKPIEIPKAQPSHSDSSQKNPSQEPKIVKDTVNITNNPTTPITPLPQPIKNMAG